MRGVSIARWRDTAAVDLDPGRALQAAVNRWAGGAGNFEQPAAYGDLFDQVDDTNGTGLLAKSSDGLGDSLFLFGRQSGRGRLPPSLAPQNCQGLIGSPKSITVPIDGSPAHAQMPGQMHSHCLRQRRVAKSADGLGSFVRPLPLALPNALQRPGRCAANGQRSINWLRGQGGTEILSTHCQNCRSKMPPNARN